MGSRKAILIDADEETSLRSLVKQYKSSTNKKGNFREIELTGSQSEVNKARETIIKERDRLNKKQPHRVVTKYRAKETQILVDADLVHYMSTYWKDHALWGEIESKCHIKPIGSFSELIITDLSSTKEELMGVIDMLKLETIKDKVQCSPYVDNSQYDKVIQKLRGSNKSVYVRIDNYAASKCVWFMCRMVDYNKVKSDVEIALEPLQTFTEPHRQQSNLKDTQTYSKQTDERKAKGVTPKATGSTAKSNPHSNPPSSAKSTGVTQKNIASDTDTRRADTSHIKPTTSLLHQVNQSKPPNLQARDDEVDKRDKTTMRGINNILNYPEIETDVVRFITKYWNTNPEWIRIKHHCHIKQVESSCYLFLKDESNMTGNVLSRILHSLNCQVSKSYIECSPFVEDDVYKRHIEVNLGVTVPVLIRLENFGNTRFIIFTCKSDNFEHLNAKLTALVAIADPFVTELSCESQIPAGISRGADMNVRPNTSPHHTVADNNHSNVKATGVKPKPFPGIANREPKAEQVGQPLMIDNKMNVETNVDTGRNINDEGREQKPPRIKQVQFPQTYQHEKGKPDSTYDRPARQGGRRGWKQRGQDPHRRSRSAGRNQHTNRQQIQPMVFIRDVRDGVMYAWKEMTS